MKKTLLIALVASMTLSGCYFDRNIDETVENDRYQLRLQSIDMIGGYAQDYDTGDTMVFSGTVPQLASTLAGLMPFDSTTMYCIDARKQFFLPSYIYTLVDRDTTQPANYLSLLQTLIQRNILRADTTYEPLRLLEIYDAERYGTNVDTLVTFDIDEFGDTNYFAEYINLVSIVNRLREQYRMPVSLAPGMDPDNVTEFYWMTGDWKSDSLWLDSRGMRIVPDPQGRKMRIVEFNRQKGKI